jgi:hypothetical protein
MTRKYIRDWVFNKIVKPFISILKSKMNNIRVENRIFYNMKNEPTPLDDNPMYSSTIKSDNYKVFDFYPTSEGRGKNIELIEDNGLKGFKVFKDTLLKINLQEGIYLGKVDRSIEVTLKPVGTFHEVFGVKENIPNGLLSRTSIAPVKSWYSEAFEWTVFVKANQAFVFDVKILEDDFETIITGNSDSDAIGLDGGMYGRLDIRGYNV